MEVVIPIEIGMPMLRTTKELVGNQEIQVTYHHKAMVYYNKWAKPQQLQVGDLVLRKMFENVVDHGLGKLQSN
ncbi:hypothetical protein AAG906_006754 [Vitis piasezkii]